MSATGKLLRDELRKAEARIAALEAENERLAKLADTVVEANAAAEGAIQRAERLEAEHDRLGKCLEHDRAVVAEGISAVRRALSDHHWLTEGRGSYEYDDDRWKDEFGQAIDKIHQALRPLAKVAGNWDGCPQTWQEILEARKNERDELAAQVAALAGVLENVSPVGRACADFLASRGFQNEQAALDKLNEEVNLCVEVARQALADLSEAARRIMAVVAIAPDARDFIRAEYQATLECVCLLTDGEPQRDRADVLSVPHLEAFESILARLDAALEEDPAKRRATGGRIEDPPAAPGASPRLHEGGD